MGAVYRAFDDRLKRTVAIKHILPDIAGDEGSRQRLRREAQAAAGLSHPSIVQIFDIFENDGIDWIVMELVEGETLQFLVESGRLGLAEIVALSREVAEGLAEAHSKNIVHRDLKTENVMVTRSFHAKILDFGLAKSMTQGNDTSITDLGSILGTGRAMSPEQAMGEEVDHRSDLFSLGTLIFESVTGRSPFSGSSVYNTLARVCSVPHRAAWKINRQVPVELSNLIDRLLEKSPEHRPQSAREVVVELRVIEKMPLPEWGGPYAPWYSSDTAQPVGNLEFLDLDPAALPPAENPPMASTFRELARLQPRPSQGEPTLEVPTYDPSGSHTDALGRPDPRLLQRVDSSTVTAEVPTYRPDRSGAFRAAGGGASGELRRPAESRAPGETDPSGERRLRVASRSSGELRLPADFVAGIRVKAVLAFQVEGAADLEPRFETLLDNELRRTLLELDGLRLTESGAAHWVLFERPVQAVRTVLRISRWLERMDVAGKLGLCCGLHLGELALTSASPASSAGARPFDGLAAHGGEGVMADKGPTDLEVRASGTSLLVAADLAAMAEPGQVLLTPEASALCRRALRDSAGRDPGTEPRWHTHGRYYLEHLEEAVEIHAISLARSLSALPPRAHDRGQLLMSRGPAPSEPAAVPAAEEEVATGEGQLSREQETTKESSGVRPPVG